MGMDLKKQIKILAQPRSGGTFMKHFFSIIFPKSIIKHDHNTNNPNNVDVVVVRDIRDSIMSGLRLYDDFNIKNGEDLNRVIKKINFNFLKKSNQHCHWVYKENKKVIVLFYEDFVNNFDFIINKIEDVWGIKVDEIKIKEAKNKLNIRAAKKIVKSPAWGDKHVGDGSIGKWKEIIPKELHEKFSNLCGVENKILKGEEYFVKSKKNG